MIVDLVRNDLGRVCRPGTVSVAALAEVRAHAGVWHMVSEVEGELRDGVGDADLLRATFPPGSVTGAPKLAALDVIAELESTGREAYTGAIGFAGPLAGLELSVAIRTFEVRGTRIWLGAGGGIVADSAGEDEAREAAAKAAPLLAAIGADPPPAAPGGAAPPRLARRGPRPVPRPDPAAGLYETLLVLAGEPQALAGPPRPARGEPARALRPRPAAGARRARPRRRGRARARPAPDRRRPRRGRGARRHARSARVAGRAAPVVVPGGLGPHKWRDRTLLEAHEADDPATLPLLLDADGVVLETSRTSVVATDAAGARHTPPADGRILPGVTVAASGARPRRLTLGDLRAAPALEVASALRGLQPATLA